MKAMKYLGVILALAGLAGLAFGGFQYTRSKEVAAVGPIQLKADETERVSVPPVMSGLAVGAGILLIAVEKLKRK